MPDINQRIYLKLMFLLGNGQNTPSMVLLFGIQICLFITFFEMMMNDWIYGQPRCLRQVNIYYEMKRKMATVDMNPLVSLIIPVKDGLKYTKMMLESFFENTEYPNYELIFVDNGSRKPTRDYLKSIEAIDIIVRFEDNVGFPAGVNAGIEEAKGDYIGILNNDILLSKGWLTKLMLVLQDNPDIGIVSPLRVGIIDGGTGILPFQYEGLIDYPDVSFTKEINLDKLRQGMSEFTEEVGDGFKGYFCTDYTMLPFFCTILRRQVFDQIGLLDEDFGIGLVEDTYFCRLAKQAGWRLASCLDCYVHHFISRTLRRMLGEKNMNQKARENYALMNAKLAKANEDRDRDTDIQQAG